MARLTALPELARISGFKGVIDYYVYHPSDPAITGVHGTPCARRWPRSPGHRRAPAVEAQWPAFSQAVTYWPQLSPEIKHAYIKMASGTGLSGRDLFTRSYLKGLYAYPTH